MGAQGQVLFGALGGCGSPKRRTQVGGTGPLQESGAQYPHTLKAVTHSMALREPCLSYGDRSELLPAG